MGYDAKTNYAEFFIHQQHFDEALSLLKTFITEHQKEYFYASFYQALEKYIDFPLFIHDLGFDYEIEDNHLSIHNFNARYSCQKELLTVICHFVTPASYMLFTGEDNSEWGLLFTGSEVIESSHDDIFTRSEKLKETLKMVHNLEKTLPSQLEVSKPKV